MTPRSVSFNVAGTPKPQGSKRAFAVNGRARMKETGGLEHAAWRNAVSEVAARHAAQLNGPLFGPLDLSVEFRFPMPASRPARIRRAGIALKTTAPDLDKLVRLIADSLSASGLIRDDAMIAALSARKTEHIDGGFGASIHIREME